MVALKATNIKLPLILFIRWRQISMNKKFYIILSLCLISFFMACRSTEIPAEHINIKERPTAIIHILDNSSDLDYKLSKVNNISLRSDTVKVPSAKAITFIFEKITTSANTTTKDKSTSFEQTENSFSWTAESATKTVTVTNTIQDLSFTCPELQENQEYTLSISSEGFVLKENSGSTLITEGSFKE